LLASIRHQSEALRQLPREALACGRILQALKKPGDGVIARKPHVAYIGGTRSVPFPNTTSLGQLASYARETNARWLYVSYPEAESRPDYFPLIDTTGTIAGLVPRCVTSLAPAVLYEIGPEFGPNASWVADPIRMNLRIARARLRLYPDDVDAMWLEAQMELLQGDWARSVATLERAARLDPRGQEPLAAVRGRDSTRAGTSLARLLSTIKPAPRPQARDDWPGR